MILLIPSFQELNLINLTDLNSIMILLILGADIGGMGSEMI